MLLTSTDLISIYLAGAPFALGGIFGSLLGGSSNRRLSGFVLLLTISLLTPLIISLIPLFPVSADLNLRLFGMAGFWMLMGSSGGYQAIKYLRFVGIPGYYFTLGFRFVGVCLSAIIVEGPLTQLLHNETIDFRPALSVYGVFMVWAIILLIPLGMRLTFQTIKKAIKEILTIFTIFGLLNFLVDFFWQDFLSDLAWWAPQMEPPHSYQVFFVLAVAILTVFPSYEPSATTLGIPVYIDDKTGLLIAQQRAEKGDQDEYEFTLLPLSLGEFTYKLPENWLVVHEEHESTKYYLWARPPGGLLDRLNASRLDLTIFQYTNSTITDEEQFKRATYMNLHNASFFVEDKISTRHGVMSHECVFKNNDIGYGYLIRFIRQRNEFVIRWFSFDGFIFRRYRPKVEEFIESFQFGSSEL